MVQQMPCQLQLWHSRGTIRLRHAAPASSKPPADMWLCLWTPDSPGSSISRLPWPAASRRCSRRSQPPPPVLTQVALLFLARDAIPTEPLWAAFIASAAELSPLVRAPPTRPRPPAPLPPISQEDFTPDCRGGMPARPREPFLGELRRSHACFTCISCRAAALEHQITRAIH